MSSTTHVRLLQWLHGKQQPHKDIHRAELAILPHSLVLQEDSKEGVKNVFKDLQPGKADRKRREDGDKVGVHCSFIRWLIIMHMFYFLRLIFYT